VTLKDLPRAEHVFQLVAPDLPSDFPALRSLSTVPNNLPVQLTSFIGREREMAEVKRLLTATRLLTPDSPQHTTARAEVTPLLLQRLIHTMSGQQRKPFLLRVFAPSRWIVLLAAPDHTTSN
jgi:hypothetical protein